MANYWGKQSKIVRATLHSELVLLFDAVLEKEDCSLLSGLRGAEEQNRLFAAGVSKAKFPRSDHNFSVTESGGEDYDLSDAVDAMPYPIEWPERETDSVKEYARKLGRIISFAQAVAESAEELGVDIKWGGMFRGFFDGAHFSRRPG